MTVLCLLLVIACCFDYRKGRIPNWLLVIIFVIGWGYSAIYQEIWGMVLFPVESIVVMLLLYPLFKIGVLGAGDVKLYGICAGYFPQDKFLFFFFFSLLIAAMISLIKMIRDSNSIERISYFCEYIVEAVQSGHFRLYIENETERRKTSICLAGPILCSVLLYMGGIY